MTWEELIAKAREHAKTAGTPLEQLYKPKVREIAVVSFIGKNSRATAEFHLDAITGELISAELSGPEFNPQVTDKQLSQRAQRVLELASEESKRMACDHVGSEHLLLGLLLDGQGSGAALLFNAGLSAKAVRSRIMAIGPTAEVASSGYAPSLRNILQVSSHYAKSFGHSEIDPEHFAPGLLEAADGPAMSLLRHFAVDVDQLKRSLLQQMARGSRCE